jgi:hypothetical protein
MSVSVSPVPAIPQGLPWAAYLPKRALAAPMACLRVRAGLMIALTATIVLLAVVALVGWFLMGGDHATWVGTSS